MPAAELEQSAFAAAQRAVEPRKIRYANGRDDKPHPSVLPRVVIREPGDPEQQQVEYPPAVVVTCKAREQPFQEGFHWSRRSKRGKKVDVNSAAKHYRFINIFL